MYLPFQDHISSLQILIVVYNMQGTVIRTKNIGLNKTEFFTFKSSNKHEETKNVINLLL